MILASFLPQQEFVYNEIVKCFHDMEDDFLTDPHSTAQSINTDNGTGEVVYNWIYL